MKSTPMRGVKEILKPDAYKQSEGPPFKSPSDLKELQIFIKSWSDLMGCPDGVPFV